MDFLRFALIAYCIACVLAGSGRADTIVLYQQDFENPAAFVNDGADVNIFNSVNQLYGNQPPGFTFAQANTVETLRITGTQAFGSGYSDPSGTGGDYALGMLATAQDDLLALSFQLGGRRFLNLSLNLSSIDLSAWGGPFAPDGGAAPTFFFTLYDNPGGAIGLGSGAVLDTAEATAPAKASKSTFLWSDALLALDASGSTDGNVILRIDLLSGGYAAVDNIRITASDTSEEIPSEVPEPATVVLTGIGLAGLTRMRRRA